MVSNVRPIAWRCGVPIADGFGGDVLRFVRSREQWRIFEPSHQLFQPQTDGREKRADARPPLFWRPSMTSSCWATVLDTLSSLVSTRGVVMIWSNTHVVVNVVSL